MNTTDDTRHIILVRHGQTRLNAEGRLRGRADPPLDPVGIAQARAAADALSSLGLSRVVSSPLHRAVETARAIADASRLEPEVDSAFNDRDYGPWTGQVKKEVIARWGSVDAAPGVETQSAVIARSRRALDAIARAADSGPIAIVTHDAVIRPILSSIRPGIDPVVATGSWAELEHTGDGWAIVSVDNVAR